MMWYVRSDFWVVHIIGLKTQYFSFVRDKQVERLKVGLWKIQDEFV